MSGECATSLNEDNSEAFKQAIFELIDQVEKESKCYSKPDDYNQSFVEYKTLVRRIFTILEVNLMKIKLAFCIPFLAENEEIFNRYFKYEDRRLIKKIYAKYSLKNDQLEKYKKDMEMDSKLLDCLNKTLNSGVWDIIPKYFEKISPSGKYFIELLTDLKSLVSERVSMTTSRSLAKDKVLHKMWLTNKRNEEIIQEYKEKIEDEKRKINKIVDEKYLIIQEYSNGIRKLEQENSEAIQDEISKSSTVLSEFYKQNELNEKFLNEKLKCYKYEYEKLLDENYLHSQQKRKEKHTAQQMLQAWINKYDKDVGTKSQELMTLKEKLADAREEFQLWTEKFNTQEIEYNQIMKEKEAEEIRIREEKLIMFMMNRAARTIQVAFRQVLLRRRLRKKGKGKGKKGKK